MRIRTSNNVLFVKISFLLPATLNYDTSMTPLRSAISVL